MSGFEEKGCEKQYLAKNKEECVCEYEISCYTCTHSTKYGWLKCDSCHIRQTHAWKYEMITGEKRVFND